MSARLITVREYQLVRGLLVDIVEEYMDGPLPIIEPPQLRNPEGDLVDAHYRWLKMLDLCAPADTVRVAVEKTSPDERRIIAVLDYWQWKRRNVDHDRFDWLLTFVFRRRVERGEIGGFSNVGAQILEMLPDLPQPSLSDFSQAQLAKLAKVMEGIHSCTRLAQLTKSGLIPQGRELKDSLSDQHYHPGVLAALVNYNLVIGKAFKDLVDDVADKDKELASTVATEDYRHNVQHLRKLAAAAGEEDLDTESLLVTGGESTELAHGLKTAVTGGTMFSGQTSSTSRPDKDPSIIDVVEKRRWNGAIATLIAHFEVPENKASNTISAGDAPLLLEEWEVRSILARYPVDEKSLRADVANALRDATILIYRLSEETEQLRRKANLQYGRQAHEDAVEWLQERGRAHLPVLKDLSAVVAQRGLAERSQQVVRTALRLSEVLAGKKLRTTIDPIGHADDLSLLTLPEFGSKKPRL